jgi:hypothetical protein
VAVVVVDDVVALGRPCTFPAGVDGGDSSIVGVGGKFFFCPPKENVRPAERRKPTPDGFGTGGTGISVTAFFCVPRHSSEAPVSAEEGAVETLLLREEELSVSVVLVVLEDPLPLSAVSTGSCTSIFHPDTYRFGFKSAKMLSSADASDPLDWWTEVTGAGR